MNALSLTGGCEHMPLRQLLDADTLCTDLAHRHGGAETILSIAEMPTDRLEWLPDFKEIEDAYNLKRLEVSHLERARDVAKTRALARFMVAYWAGPRHACQIVEGMGEMALERASGEFLALWNALTSPHRVVGRHYTVTTAPEGLGHRLRLQPTDKVPGRPTFSRNYRDEVAMRHDANVLTAMLTDADWKAYSEELIFEAWQELVASKSLAEDWLAGRGAGSLATGGILPAVTRRARIKRCRAPGVQDGCYRGTVGQICPSGRSNFAIRQLQEVYGLPPGAYQVVLPHPRAALMPCADMASALWCCAHYIAEAATYASRPAPEVYAPERQDSRLEEPGNLRAEPCRVIDPILSSMGGPAVSAVVAIFASTRADTVADRCVKALGLLPDWLTFSSLPRSPPRLASLPQQILDRTDMLSAARPSLDRIWSVIVEGERIAAHSRDNVRLTDWARNFARGSSHTALAADLLEAAIVVNNTIRHALGDNIAASRLEEIRLRLLEAAEQPDLGATKPSRELLYDYANRNRTALEAQRTGDTYSPTLGSYPVASCMQTCQRVEAACVELLTSLRDSALSDAADDRRESGAESAAIHSIEPTEPEEGLADAVSGISDEADEADIDGDGGLNDIDGTFSLHRFTAQQIAAVAKVAVELEVQYGRSLPRLAGQRLPRLPFAPMHWTDNACLSYAMHANAVADICDEVGPCYPPPATALTSSRPDTRTDEAKSPFNDQSKANRSAGTLFLAWVRLELQGKLTSCRLTGLPLLWLNASAPARHPLLASRAAHRIHRWPIDYGFDSPWPTTLAAFSESKFNVSVESWFANKWLKSWRLPTLTATLARRTEWYLQYAHVLGLTPLTAEEKNAVRNAGSAAVRFRHQESLSSNVLTKGEQVVLARQLERTS